MTKKTLLVLSLIVLSLCALGAVCAAAGYMGYRATKLAANQVGSSAPIEATRDRVQDQEAPADGVLRLSGGLPPTLDPALVQDSTSAEYIVHLFSGLVRLDGDLQIVPDLAQRWDISEDGRAYTFYLRSEATFADGRSITTEDLIYSMERACDPELGSTVSGAYLGDILGVEDVIAGRASRIAGLAALDEHTLQIQIDAPKAYFLAKLTYPTAFVVDRLQIERAGAAWVEQPNGSGPFLLESMSRDEIVLVRNPRYYGHRPALARVEYTLSGGLPLTMYENDQLDIAEVPPSDVVRITDPDNPLSREYRAVPELSVQYLAFNVERPPFDDLTVRQAFAHAIDRTKLADLVLEGTASAAKGILPPGLPDYDPTLEGLAYDPERARTLLAGSRYGGSGQMPELTLAVSGSSAHMAPTTRALLAMIEENLDLQITVEQVEWPYFLRDLNQHRYQMFTSGWIADYPDS
ncbi:MAG: peptide ABC transporter substrate-binding protein, partial [Anaerolineae bacterium]|nr:peptide ABC transporter substrate-binding protein [Anaerolineae bacterium]